MFNGRLDQFEKDGKIIQKIGTGPTSRNYGYWVLVSKDDRNKILAKGNTFADVLNAINKKK